MASLTSGVTVAFVLLLVGSWVYCLLTAIAARRYLAVSVPDVDALPPVSVLKPICGLDDRLEENLRSFFSQDYPDYDVTFIVESGEDPAFTALRNLGIRNILIAGHATDCGQKVHNLAYAISHSGHTGGILVLCDSDARFSRHWLSKLVAPLEATNITTGYRWYVAARANLPTLMRSGWNASSVGVLGDQCKGIVFLEISQIAAHRGREELGPGLRRQGLL